MWLLSRMYVNLLLLLHVFLCHFAFASEFLSGTVADSPKSFHKFCISTFCKASPLILSLHFCLQKVWLATSLCCLRSGDLVGTVMIVTMGVTKTTTAATLRSQSVWTPYVTQDSLARAVSRWVFVIYPFRCDKTENIAVSCWTWLKSNMFV